MSKPISPLRQRMIDDMILRNMATGTQKAMSPPLQTLLPFMGSRRIS